MILPSPPPGGRIERPPLFVLTGPINHIVLNMHRILRSTVLVLALSVAWGTTASAQDERVIDEIVAVVGNDILLASDVDGYVISTMNQQQIPYTDDLWRQALEQLVNDKVLVNHAKRDTNLVVSDQQVEQMLDQRIGQMSRRVGGEAVLEQMYGKTVLEIKADFREEFRDQLLADQFRGQKLRSIKATPTDVRAWFQQFPTDSLPTLPDIVQVSHIVRLPEVTDEARSEAMEIISAIRDSVIAGRLTIEEMAELFSDDPGSASNGGLYEDMALSDVVPEFAAVASRSPIGVFSPVFETEFGLHFLRVNARRGERIDYNHILIAFDERKSDPEKAISLLTTLRDSILTHGARFEVLAREFSQEEMSRSRGGRVSDPQSGEQNLYIDALGPLWQQTLSGLEPGDISEPAEVQLLDGRQAYHIVQLHKRVPEHTVNLETDYALIEQLALQEKQTTVLSEWMDRLKRTVHIEYRGRASDLAAATN